MGIDRNFPGNDFCTLQQLIGEEEPFGEFMTPAAISLKHSLY